MPDPPAYLLTATVWAYWIGTCVMISRVRRKHRKAACFVPSVRLERLLWPIWLPLVVAWIALLTMAVLRGPFLVALPEFVVKHPAFTGIRWAAALSAVLFFFGTVECWIRMGKNWGMTVTPDQKTELVTKGLYARVRHPIYALSVLLMASSAIILPEIPMIAVAAIHISFMVIKARNEERFLLKVHGEKYSNYQKRTGHFFPRLFVRDR